MIVPFPFPVEVWPVIYLILSLLIYSSACTSDCSHVHSVVCDWRITCLLLSDFLSKSLAKHSIIQEQLESRWVLLKSDLQQLDFILLKLRWFYFEASKFRHRDISHRFLRSLWLAHVVGLCSVALPVNYSCRQGGAKLQPWRGAASSGKRNSLREQGAHSSQCVGLGALDCGVITDLLANNQHLPDKADFTLQLLGCCFPTDFIVKLAMEFIVRYKTGTVTI